MRLVGPPSMSSSSLSISTCSDAFESGRFEAGPLDEVDSVRYVLKSSAVKLRPR
jgi:hypothetical protein